jgi:predicted ATP-binding protein involved in virulence
MLVYNKLMLFLFISVPVISMAQVKKDLNNKQSERKRLDSLISFYSSNNDMDNQIKYTVEKYDKLGIDTAGLDRVYTNNTIYEVLFMYSDDTTVLKKSADWMKLIIDSEPPTASHMDTYANVLYKLGRKKSAIAWQTKACALEPNDAQLSITLEKMKNNQPTWKVK